jgi:hypothetical protein
MPRCNVRCLAPKHFFPPSTPFRAPPWAAALPRIARAAAIAVLAPEQRRDPSSGLVGLFPGEGPVQLQNYRCLVLNMASTEQKTGVPGPRA